MIVTIDGPAGAGKSTVARLLAHRLGFRFLDTGAMYRAVALAAHERGLDWNDDAGLVALAQGLCIELPGDRVLVDGRDVTDTIRTVAVTNVTKHAANNPGVRRHLVELQRQHGVGENLVTDGRDQGTVVFPEAACKIYLVAGAEERARRRQADLAARGEPVPFERLLAEQERRDASDANRDEGPLAKAADAVEVCTDGLSIEQVVERLETLVRSRMPGGGR